VWVRACERGPAPVFTPAQAEAILDGSSGRARVGRSFQLRTINKNLQTIDLFHRVMSHCRTEAAEALDDARWRLREHGLSG
jgi:hypothetical protein